MARDIRHAFAKHSKAARERFLLSLTDPQAAQAAVLNECIARNADTSFGKEHGFNAVKDLDAYRSAVPLRSYDELAPWIDRAADGEENVLTAETPVRFWKTTGTTSAAKKIPITPAAAFRVTESFLALQGTQFFYYPELNERSDTILYSHISPKTIKERLKSGIPYCSNTEAPVEVRAGHEEFVAPWLMPLQAVVEDDSERLYFLLCFAALHDLYAVACLHPSRLQTIAGTLDRSWQRLVRELHDGTVLGSQVRDPNPEKAKQLEAVATSKGTLTPKDIWPNLRFVSSWSGSYIERYARVMQDAFAPKFLAMPSISSECFMTMTIDEDRIGHPLNVRGGIFEFIPSGQPVTNDTPTLRFDQLVDGESYEMVITTLGGLYRYAIADIFRVTGFVHKVPRLEYVGRRAVSDLTGEKLAEEQVTEVVPTLLARFELGVVNFTVCGLVDPGPGVRPHYAIVIEAENVPAQQLDEVANAIDERLRRANSRYELKRSFNDLGCVVIECVPLGTFAAHRSLLIERGAPPGQVKEKVLHPIGGPVLADLRRLAARKR
jgi:hypothetical protein